MIAFIVDLVVRRISRRRPSYLVSRNGLVSILFFERFHSARERNLIGCSSLISVTEDRLKVTFAHVPSFRRKERKDSVSLDGKQFGSLRRAATRRDELEHYQNHDHDREHDQNHDTTTTSRRKRLHSRSRFFPSTNPTEGNIDSQR